MEASVARRKVVDPIRVAVKTTPGPRDAHVHCAVVDDDGNGRTSTADDGHSHQVIELEVQPQGGHTHDLSARRCDREHNVSANHPIARRKRH